MDAKKLIVVLGATGNQGGSVVKTLLQESGWRVRGITRNTISAKARNLAALGVEMVAADLDSPSSLLNAFKDAHAIFAVSDFWGLYGDPATKERAEAGQPLNVWAANHETQQLQNAIDAAAQTVSLERFILSSLPDATKWSHGKYTHVFHYDSKAKAAYYAKDTYPELWAKTSIFYAGAFLSSLITSPATGPAKNSDGVFEFSGPLDPDVKLPLIAAEEDSGPLVRALVFEAPGKTLIGYREWLTMREMAQVFSDVIGTRAEVVHLPKFRVPFPEEIEEEMADTMGYYSEFGYEGRADPTVMHPKDLSSPPKLDTVADYFKKQDWSHLLAN